MRSTTINITQVVRNGLCIGCGLCEAIAPDRVKMKMTDYGSLRPSPTNLFTTEEEARLLACCPGVIAESRIKTELHKDLIWGHYSSMSYAWAGDPELRFRAAAGGALTALGVHLLKSRLASFILHVRAIPEQPMRSQWTISTTPEQVISSCGSRYGPVAPLAGLIQALDRNQPFAIIAKPCDIGAVHRYSQLDSRVNELCVARLVMVCGGQSRLTKSSNLLKQLGVEEDELSLFRYRGYGNPGSARVETTDGGAYEIGYVELWQDEASWMLETRCKMCPDALGEAADIAASDVWPGGGPVGEDDGFDGIIVRSEIGEELIKGAVESGILVLGEQITAEQFNDFQPHQVRKKHALSARYQGMREAGLSDIKTVNLRLEELSKKFDSAQHKIQVEGTKRRVRDGRIVEPAC